MQKKLFADVGLQLTKNDVIGGKHTNCTAPYTIVRQKKSIARDNGLGTVTSGYSRANPLKRAVKLAEGHALA